MADENLHGESLPRSEVALLLVDVINDLEFPEAELIEEAAFEAARQIARLRRHANEAEVPVIYANDNFGRWKSDFRAQVEHCLHDRVRGQRLAELLRPGTEDYFVLKPRHSAFFSTTLDLLLKHLGVRTLILVGFAGNLCVLFTANDAYLREYRLIVPSDCIASNTPEDNRQALALMQNVLKADIRPSESLTTDRLKQLKAGTAVP